MAKVINTRTPSIERNLPKLANELLTELKNNDELKYAGFIFKMAKDEPEYFGTPEEKNFTIVVTPPNNNKLLCDQFTCTVCNEDSKITVLIDLMALNSEEMHSGAPFYMATKDIGYKRKMLNTNKDVIEELCRMAKTVITPEEIFEHDLHKKLKCDVYGLCTLQSKYDLDIKDIIKIMKNENKSVDDIILMLNKLEKAKN